LACGVFIQLQRPGGQNGGIRKSSCEPACWWLISQVYMLVLALADWAFTTCMKARKLHLYTFSN
jgi:hypothetical protein